MTDVARRSRIDLFSTGEKAIYDAVIAVEAMGADVRLTRAVNLLHEARSAVADFVDAIPHDQQTRGAQIRGIMPTEPLK